MAKDQHWADGLAERWVAKGQGKHLVEIGWSPSGAMHVGFLREMILGDILFRALSDAGADVKFVFFVDSFDPLRDREADGKPWYKFLPESYRQHVGKPVFTVPDPGGVYESYVERFFAPVKQHMKSLGIHPEIHLSHEEYKRGAFTDIISAYLENNEKVRKILADVTGEGKAESWCGLRALCQGCGRIDRNRITGWDIGAVRASYTCSCGHSGEADYSKGEAKLDWRLDWPARWAMLGVTEEPFGKDHSAAGGSYDSGKRLCREVLGKEPPEPVLYEWLHDKEGRPLSSSRGVVIDPAELLRSAAPEIIRYFIVSNRPTKAISFDPGAGLLDLYRDYERVETALNTGQSIRNDDKRNYEFCQIEGSKKGGMHIPYRNLISLLQISGGDRQRLKGMMARGDYKDALNNWDEVEPKIRYAESWIELYAPAETKMQILDDVPVEVSGLDRKTKDFLLKLSDLFKGDVPSAEDIHNRIYTIAREDMGLDPKQAFEAVYLAFIGQRRGPRAGWFLHSLEPEFVVERLNKAGRS